MKCKLSKLCKLINGLSIVGVLWGFLAVIVALHSIRQVTGESYCIYCSNEGFWVQSLGSLSSWMYAFWNFQPMTLLGVSISLLAVCVMRKPTVAE